MILGLGYEKTQEMSGRSAITLNSISVMALPPNISTRTTARGRARGAAVVASSARALARVCII